MHCHECRGQESYSDDVRLTQGSKDMSIRGDSYGTASEKEIAEPISLCPNLFWRTFDHFGNPHFDIVTQLLEIANAGEEQDDRRAENQKENKNDHRITAESTNSQTKTREAEDNWSSPKLPTNHGSGVTDFVLCQKSLLHGQFWHGFAAPDKSATA